jgi:D-glycero-D-manno-heptose 1,7-bisphosphate phosphatase
MKAIFLDRDGVINDNSQHYYTYKTVQWKFNPGIIDVLKQLTQQGFGLFIVTNQGGISRGCYTKKEVEILHTWVLSILEKEGISIIDIAVCPHHNLLENCLCRKPKPLMLEKLIARYGVDIEQSWFIGDSKSDFETAQAVGMRALLVPANANILPFIKEID